MRELRPREQNRHCLKSLSKFEADRAGTRVPLTAALCSFYRAAQPGTGHSTIPAALLVSGSLRDQALRCKAYGRPSYPQHHDEQEAIARPLCLQLLTQNRAYAEDAWTPSSPDIPLLSTSFLSGSYWKKRCESQHVTEPQLKGTLSSPTHGGSAFSAAHTPYTSSFL